MSDSFNRSLFSEDLLTRIIRKVTAAAENRLDGCPLPAMSSSGAGTKGLVVSIPVNEVAEELHISLEKKLKALALTHLVNRYINAHIGKLSPMCTCVMASSTSASVGIALLLQVMPAKKYLSMLMIGFVFSAYLNVPMLGVSIIGLAIAYYFFTTQVNKAPAVATEGAVIEEGDDWDE